MISTIAGTAEVPFSSAVILLTCVLAMSFDPFSRGPAVNQACLLGELSCAFDSLSPCFVSVTPFLEFRREGVWVTE